MNYLSAIFKFGLSSIGIITVYSVLFYCFMPLQIGLQPLGEVRYEYLSLVEKELEAFYKANVIILKPQELPIDAYDSKRKRYNANKILSYLWPQKLLQFHKIMGVTEVDILSYRWQMKPIGVLGLANIYGRASVISTYRCGKKASKKRKRDRFAKNALHEMGHNLGLPHCESKSRTCFMNDSKGTIKTIDRERRHLCTDCQRKIGNVIRKTIP